MFESENPSAITEGLWLSLKRESRKLIAKAMEACGCFYAIFSGSIETFTHSEALSMGDLNMFYIHIAILSSESSSTAAYYIIFGRTPKSQTRLISQ